jgi:NAD(P)H-dependent flavin oxidoreductase YrpB (nitropropane dioxygenase family)
MYTTLCQSYSIDVPIFAFSYSPAVVAAASQAGGLGVLGATGWEPEQLRQALQWITQQCDGKPYGIDLVISYQFAFVRSDNIERRVERTQIGINGSSALLLPWQRIIFPLPLDLARLIRIVPDERQLIDLWIQQIGFPDIRGDFL